MLKLKNKNGITLIALIITIIVMLILVGVTLNMVLDENGIIAEAKKAKEKMESATEAETLQTAVLGAIGTDGKIDFEKLDQNLPTGFEGSNGTYESSNGNRFVVSNNGNTTNLDGKLASYVQYKNLKWRVLKDDDTGVELLCDNAIGSFTPNVIRPDPGTPSIIEVQLSIAIEAETEITENIRSIIIADLDLAETLGLMVSGNSTEYFLDYMEEIPDENDSNLAHWYIYSVNSLGDVVPIHLFSWNYNISEASNINSTTKAFRPVVSLEAGALDNASGSGTSGQPYVIAD